MAIEDYTVANDYFEPLTEAGSVYFNGDFAFPCCVCIHNDKTETQHPCDKCGHNVKTRDGEGNLSSESNMELPITEAEARLLCEKHQQEEV